MAQSIVGMDNIQPYKFSECSLSDYIESLRLGHGICLFNPPNQVRADTLPARAPLARGESGAAQDRPGGSIARGRQSIRVMQMGEKAIERSRFARRRTR